MSQADCIFCGIVSQKINAKIIAKNEKALAFLDLNPVAEHHILIIPKEHIESVNQLSEDNVHVIADMMLLAKELAAQLHIADRGFRLVMNTGKQAGQSVFHLHLHLLGGRDFSWPPG